MRRVGTISSDHLDCGVQARAVTLAIPCQRVSARYWFLVHRFLFITPPMCRMPASVFLTDSATLMVRLRLGSEILQCYTENFFLFT